MLRRQPDCHRCPHDRSERAAPRDEGDRRAGVRAPDQEVTGHKDPFCTVEEGPAAYRALPAGELAVLPDTGHLITPAAVQTTIEFFERL